MPTRCRTNWWLNARDTPEIPNSNQTCSSGLACPVFSRSMMKLCIFSRGMRSSSIRAATCWGVSWL